MKANTTYGFRATTLRHLTPKPLYSDYKENTFDLRDFGARSTVVTGSIAAGSTSLALGSVPTPPFAVGDPIIVELGGEAGAGARGTRGVGGTWPALSYATTTSMNADSAQVANTFAWVQASGAVYQFLSGSWTIMDQTHLYYTNTVYPLALTARVISVSADGQTLTLDTPASVASVGANVYFNNQDVLGKLTKDPHYDGEMNYPNQTVSNDFTAILPQIATIFAPVGNYALSDLVNITYHPGWNIVGQGTSRAAKFFSPKGVISAGIQLYQSPYFGVRGISITGNALDNGYGLAVTQTAVTQGASYPNGLQFQLSDYSTASNITSTNMFAGGVHSAQSRNVFADHIDVYSQGLQIYVTWFVEWSDSIGGGCTDCTVTSAKLTKGFEMFKTTGAQFVRCSGTNAVVAMNNAGGYLLKNMTLAITPNSYVNEIAFSHYEPLLNINTNIGSGLVATGGTVTNLVMTQAGYINANNDSLTGIIVNDNTPNVTVNGGSYTAPDYLVPSILAGAVGFTTTGDNTVVDGLTVVGHVGPGTKNINMLGLNGVLRNCTAHEWRTLNGSTVTNCATN